MRSNMRWLLTIGIVALGAALLFPGRYLAQTAGSGVVFVRGSVAVALAGPAAKRIALPGASVFLVLSPGGAVVASTVTDLSGRYILKNNKGSGVFQVCLEASGYERTCSKSFGLERKSLSVPELTLRAPSGQGAAAYGSVRLRDGRLARGFAPYADVNAYATVTLKTANDSFRTVVNEFGEYVVPTLPIGASFTLSADAESEHLERDIQAQSGLQPGQAYPLDFVLTNAAPRVRLLSATLNGALVQQAAPGSTITLNAVADDPDGDALEYRWVLPGGAGFVGPNSSPQLQWKVPSQKGRFPIYVLVSDRRGGHSESSLMITAATGNTRFSGSVVDLAGAPIGGATVEVNGRLTTTSALGKFSLNVPVRDKYVMNIHKAGLESPGLPSYGGAAFVYKAPIVGGRWSLRPAQVYTVDPTLPITVQHQRDGRCAGLVASTLDWKAYSSPTIIERQDGRGNVTSLAELGAKDPRTVQNLARLMGRVSSTLVDTFGRATGQRLQVDTPRIDCSRGVKVEIPANALVDRSTGLPPSGKIQLSVSTVDLTADQMPGDYSAFDGNNKPVSMESFGAGSFELGAGTQRFNLKPGLTATVTIPVDGTQLAGRASLPATIPFMFYDEALGTWHQEQEAVLNGSGASATYVMKVPHFSTMNADILKTGQSCVAVELDPAAGFTLPLPVEVVMQPSQPNPGVIQVRTLTVDSTKSNVIYNLPNNSDIVLTPIIPGVLPDGSSGNVPAGVFVVNTGGPQSSAVNPPTPNPDGTYYAEVGGNPTGPCASRVTLRKLSPVTLANGQEYLQGLSFQASNIDEFAGAVANEIESGALDYYDQADPRGGRASLNLFKSKNRFGLATGPGEAEYDAQFANSGDLGFGRDMHCRRNAASDGQFDYACYVTNYGQFPTNNPDQQDADDVLDPAHIPDATVAMEFSRVENPSGDPVEFPDNDRAVKFYVYDTKNPDNAPLIKADLDNHGNRPVPQLCMACHGGQVASIPADLANPAGPKKGAFSDRSDILAMGANFLPFDLHYYNFPATKPKAIQQTAIKNLNTEIVRGVANATGTGAAIVSLIDDVLYAGGSGTQLETKVAPGWDTGNPSANPDRFYRDAFARACRTCHVASPFGAPVFTDKGSFEGLITNVQLRVCNQKVMPHAQRTNDIFWSSLNPNMAGLLELYGQTLPGWSPLDTAQCGQAYQPGGTAPTVFANQIYRVLFNQCSGCHSATGLANFAVTDVAGTYNSIMTATAKDGVSKYIVPNNTGASKLYQRILGNGGTRMPQGGANLTTTDTDIPPDGVIDATEIQAWINAGAVGP